MVRAFIMRFCWILSFRSLYFSRCAGVMRSRRSCTQSAIATLEPKLDEEVRLQDSHNAPLAVPDMQQQEQEQRQQPAGSAALL